MDVYDAHKTDVEARQGSRRLGNFRVLIISMVLIVVVFTIVFAVFFLNTPAVPTSP